MAERGDPEAEEREETDDERESEAKHAERAEEFERTTAPQSRYTSRHVAIGVVVTLVGILVTFGIPLLLG